MDILRGLKNKIQGFFTWAKENFFPVVELECTSIEQSPPISEINRLALNASHLSLLFPSDTPEQNLRDYVSQLKIEPLLSDFTIFYNGEFKKFQLIKIIKVVNKSLVLENLAEIQQAYKDYRETCLKLQKNYSEGMLTPDYEVFPHGGHLRIENLKTGQIVEAPLDSTFEAHSSVDPFFFSIFVKSSAGYSKIKQLIKHDFHDGLRILDILKEFQPK